MYPPIVEQVVTFYNALFDQIFADPFRSEISDLLKRKALTRQIEEAADAASQSLTRFFVNEQVSEQQAAQILNGYAPLAHLLTLSDVSNLNVSPEAIVESLHNRLSCPSDVEQAKQAAIYRIGLLITVQVLTRVGPIVAEWRKLHFASSFELLRRVTGQLNRISEQLDALGSAGREAADDRYELTYRDYLLSRFRMTETGTVRITTNMDVDLRELFVMPEALPRQDKDGIALFGQGDDATLMNLAAARELLAGAMTPKTQEETKAEPNVGISALDFVKQHRRSVIVGTPGSGKSTFLEWLQIKVAAAEEFAPEEYFILGEAQAIPLLLRVRQLDMRDLPTGRELIAKATVSRDRADLMPPEWIERQMQNGRVLFMMDGLDETDPALRDEYLLPWLSNLCEQYPQCYFLISSRPVGYAGKMLHGLDFTEAHLQDFDDVRVSEYATHWCTAIRLSRSEPEEEARNEGAKDGQTIVDSFKTHAYIRDLARNPLMLSAICLVNYFEGGELPSDRAMLYQLCVEGLLHHWDQRRGIRSEYALEEKLRVCRELAIAMQADDRAEYPIEKVQVVFAAVLKDEQRAANLLEHIRYRAGLLIERRPGIFAFAHLTFQEYLAARAVYEGNQLNINAEQLAREHDDGRWSEAIALYCGLVPAPVASAMINNLIDQQYTRFLSGVLAEAYLSACSEIRQDKDLRDRVIQTIVPARKGDSLPPLDRFQRSEVLPVVLQTIGTDKSAESSEGFWWFLLTLHHKDISDEQVKMFYDRLLNAAVSAQAAELVTVLHACGNNSVLLSMAVSLSHNSVWSVPSSNMSVDTTFMAVGGLSWRVSAGLNMNMTGVDAAVLRIMRNIVHICHLEDPSHSLIFTLPFLALLLKGEGTVWKPYGHANSAEFIKLAREIAYSPVGQKAEEVFVNIFLGWADQIEQETKMQKVARPKRSKAQIDKPEKDTKVEA